MTNYLMTNQVSFLVSGYHGESIDSNESLLYSHFSLLNGTVQQRKFSSDRAMKEGATVFKVYVHQPFPILSAVSSVDIADHAGQSFQNLFCPLPWTVCTDQSTLGFWTL